MSDIELKESSHIAVNTTRCSIISVNCELLITFLDELMVLN